MTLKKHFKVWKILSIVGKKKIAMKDFNDGNSKQKLVKQNQAYFLPKYTSFVIPVGNNEF